MKQGNFVCTSCWDYMETIRIKDLPDKPMCPRCGSFALGLLKVDEEKALPLIEKKGRLAKDEEKMQLQAKRTAELIEKYGKVAAVALSARRSPNSWTLQLFWRRSLSFQTDFTSWLWKLNVNH